MINIPVSVIIPNYNSGNLLELAIQSINSEVTAVPQEIIIYDDCSIDDSFKVAQSLASKYSNIILRKGDSNKGAAISRKKALEIASQEYIFFLDADDLVSSNALIFAYEKILATSSDACVIDLMGLDEYGISELLIDLSHISFPISGRDACRKTLIGWDFHLYGLVRREIYTKHYKNFFATYTNADELLSRMVMNDCRAIDKSSGKYFLRKNPNSTTRKISPKLIGNCYAYKNIRNFCVEQKFLTQDVNGYLWGETVKNLWFIFRKRIFWEKVGAKSEYLTVFRATLIDLIGWPKGKQDFLMVKRNLFYKLKTLLKFYFLFVFEKLI